MQSCGDLVVSQPEAHSRWICDRRVACIIEKRSFIGVQLWSGHLEVNLQPARLIYPLHGAHNLSGRESCSKQTKSFNKHYFIAFSPPRAFGSH